jgi:hypothetical protein
MLDDKQSDLVPLWGFAALDSKGLLRDNRIGLLFVATD